MTAKKLNRCQACWSLYLARFDFLLPHYPRHTIGKPDGLSRRANHRNRASDNKNIVLLQWEFLAVRALEGVELTGIEQKILSDIHKGKLEWRPRGTYSQGSTRAPKLRQQDSTLLRVVEHRWPTPVPREDICTAKSGPTQIDCSPLP